MKKNTMAEYMGEKVIQKEESCECLKKRPCRDIYALAIFLFCMGIAAGWMLCILMIRIRGGY